MKAYIYFILLTVSTLTYCVYESMQDKTFANAFFLIVLTGVLFIATFYAGFLLLLREDRIWNEQQAEKVIRNLESAPDKRRNCGAYKRHHPFWRKALGLGPVFKELSIAEALNAETEEMLPPVDVTVETTIRERTLHFLALIALSAIMFQSPAYAAPGRIKCPVIGDLNSTLYSQPGDDYKCFKTPRAAKKAGFLRRYQTRPVINFHEIMSFEGQGSYLSPALNLNGFASITVNSYACTKPFELKVFNAETNALLKTVGGEVYNGGFEQTVSSEFPLPVYFKIKGGCAWKVVPLKGRKIID